MCPGAEEGHGFNRMDLRSNLLNGEGQNAPVQVVLRTLRDPRQRLHQRVEARVRAQVHEVGVALEPLAVRVAATYRSFDRGEGAVDLTVEREDAGGVVERADITGIDGIRAVDARQRLRAIAENIVRLGVHAESAYVVR